MSTSWYLFFTMGCSHSIIPAVDEPLDLAEANGRASKLLRDLRAGHLKKLTLQSYTSMGMQDAQYSPNMTIEDKLNLDRLWRICEHCPEIRETRVGDLMDNTTSYAISKAAREAEDNMIKVIEERPDLAQWFREYNPPHYMFNSHPNLDTISNLTESDGHSGASFALCCRAARNRMVRN